MAPETWSNLPPDILSKISKILNSDVDTLRLRSVCSPWRSSVRPRLRPSPFPLQLPKPWNCEISSRFIRGRYVLNYTTLYSLSPPEHGPRAGDPSDGWLFRVLEVNPNRFSLVGPLVPDRIEIESPSGTTMPKSLNLLDYAITEICRCYALKYVDKNGFATAVMEPYVGKIIVLWNWNWNCAVGSDFTVLVHWSNFTASYWKLGQKEWTSIDCKGERITDVALCNGNCYAISEKGVLFSFDSNLNLKLVSMPRLPMPHPKTVNYLVEYKLDLYVVERVYEDVSSDDEEDESIIDEPERIPIAFRCEIFKKCKNWERIRCLGDAVFLSCEDVSVGFSAEGFRCCKGNSVYASIANFFPAMCGLSQKFIYYGVYDVSEGTTSLMNGIKDCTFMYWPPPRWLTSG